MHVYISRSGTSQENYDRPDQTKGKNTMSHLEPLKEPVGPATNDFDWGEVVFVAILIAF